MILILIVSLVLLYFVQDKVYEKYWNRSLSVAINFDEDYIFEGESSALTEEIVNAKVLPLPILHVAFQIHKNLGFVDPENTSVSDMCYKRDIFSVLFYQKITRKLEFVGEKRGFFQITNADILSNDLFTSKNFYGALPQNTSFYVYPRPADASRIEVPFKKMMGTVRSRQFLYEDPFEFRGIREYEISDAMNKVNWKASARTGELMVNVFDSTSSQEVILFLDVEDETLWKYHELHEAGIRIAAALAQKFLEAGIPASVLCNGKDMITKKIITIPAGTGKSQINSIFQCLARIDLNLGAAHFEEYILEMAQEKAGKNPLYIMISKNKRDNLVEAFLQLNKQAIGGYWIAPLHEDMEQVVLPVSDVEVIRWEVSK